nr:hypothetical protein [Rickettsia australis]
MEKIKESVSRGAERIFNT